MRKSPGLVIVKLLQIKFLPVVPWVFLTSMIMLVVIPSAKSQETSSSRVDKSTASTDKQSSFTQLSPLITFVQKSQPVQPITKIPHVNEIEHPFTSAKMLVQSPVVPTTPTREIVQVTNVKANRTAKGVELILQTIKGQQLPITNRSSGNDFIVDLPNAQLRLPNGQAFTFVSNKPIKGITQIRVNNLDASTIRVTVLGEASAPPVELFYSPSEGLIFSFASSTTAPQQRQQVPTPPPPQAAKPVRPRRQQSPSAPANQATPEVVVTGEKPHGYSVPNASTATRTDTPLRDIPQSIQVVPQQVLKDQQAITVEDALRNVSGVTPSVGFYGVSSDFVIRGFSTIDGNFLRNGLRDSFGAFDSENPNLEQVEVLRGPASVLYGYGSPGGTINVVTKQPLPNPFYLAEATVGSYDFYRGALDLSGPINDSKTILYRLNTAYRSSGSFVDFIHNDVLGIDPVFSFAIGERTRLTIEGEYTARTDGNYPGVPVGVDVPRSLNLSGPSVDIKQTIGRVGYRLEHRFSDNWSLRNAFSTKIYHYSDNLIYPGKLQADKRTLTRTSRDFDSNNDEYFITSDLTGRFSTGDIKHQLLVGLDLGRNTTSTVVNTGTAAPIDIFTPEYNQSRGPLSPNSNTNTTTDSLGVFLQDQVALLENLKLLVGGRVDLFEQRGHDFIKATNNSQSDNAFSPRVGIVYQPIEPISLYASYARSFTPTTGTASNGSPFKPERGTQYEIGVKAQLNKQLSATLALYDLSRSNVLTNDPVNPNFSIQTGKQHSQGIELDLSGQLLPGWNIIAGYAYTDAHITEDETYKKGNLLNNVPQNTFNLWSTYTIQQGELKGLGLGLGLFFVDKREGDLNNSFKLPSYLRTDAAIFYKRGRFRSAINFNNLFNVKYFEAPGYFGPSAFYGTPLTVQGTVSWEF